MIVHARTGAARAAELCGAGVEIVELPIDDSWFRDTGPDLRRPTTTAERVALDWVFNGWGGKFAPWDADAAVAGRWAEHAGHAVRAVPMVLEGGSIAVDGDGTLRHHDPVPDAPEPQPAT